MRLCQAFYHVCFFCNKFNKFDNTGAWMLRFNVRTLALLHVVLYRCIKRAMLCSKHNYVKLKKKICIIPPTTEHLPQMYFLSYLLSNSLIHCWWYPEILRLSHNDNCLTLFRQVASLAEIHYNPYFSYLFPLTMSFQAQNTVWFWKFELMIPFYWPSKSY